MKGIVQSIFHTSNSAFPYCMLFLLFRSYISYSLCLYIFLFFFLAKQNDYFTSFDSFLHFSFASTATFIDFYLFTQLYIFFFGKILSRFFLSVVCSLQILTGNINTYSEVENILQPIIFASKIRLYPYSQYDRTVCLRVEVVGCIWDGEYKIE